MKFTYQIEREGAVVGRGELARGGAPGCAWEVETLEVLSRYRNQGIGSEIMRAICEDADAEGETLWLYACPDPGRRDDLVRFYERFGFVVRNPEARSPNMKRQPRRALGAREAA